MRPLPSITVVTPSYNQRTFLQAAVESVLHQDYPALQYLIRDGGSTDGTVDYLRSLPPSVRWISERDGGQADAVNRGWREATGEILGWLNSDDLYEAGTLQRVGEVFAAEPDLAWIVGRCRIIDQEGYEIRSYVTRYKDFLLDRISLPLLLVQNPIAQMAVFVRRQAAEEVGLLRTDLHYVMDYDLWLRLARRSMPRVLPDVLASFRMYRGTKSVDGVAAEFEEAYVVARQYARTWGLGWTVPLHRMAATGTVAAYRVLNRVSSRDR